VKIGILEQAVHQTSPYYPVTYCCGKGNGILKGNSPVRRIEGYKMVIALINQYVFCNANNGSIPEWDAN
jgi:hypothetical protein